MFFVMLAYSFGYLQGYMFSPGKPGGLVSGDVGLQVFYLYPQRCIDCVEGTSRDCEFCSMYYNERVLDSVSESLGFPLKWYPSSLVSEGSVFVAGNGNVGLGVADNKFSIANTVCKITGHERACSLRGQELERSIQCLEKYGIHEDTLIYHYTTRGDCSHCEDTTRTMNQYVGETGDDVVWIDHSNKTQLNILNDCMRAFSTRQYVPELLCPENGLSIVGRISNTGKVEKFAEDCG
mgnify:FL=1